MSDEEYGICPFDSNHQIVLYRMPAHIIKCRKNYRGPPMELCVYNATHYVPNGKMQDHLERCRDRYLFNEAKYAEIALKSIRQDV